MIAVDNMGPFLLEHAAKLPDAIIARHPVGSMVVGTALAIGGTIALCKKPIATLAVVAIGTCLVLGASAYLSQVNIPADIGYLCSQMVLPSSINTVSGLFSRIGQACCCANKPLGCIVGKTIAQIVYPFEYGF